MIKGLRKLGISEDSIDVFKKSAKSGDLDGAADALKKGSGKGASGSVVDDLAGGKTGNHKFWDKQTTFNGNKVFQRDDLFDPKTISSWKVNGKTVTGANIERMASGRAPIGFDGKPIYLHHLIQTQSGGIAEVSQTFHQKYYSAIHINTGQFPSGINRSEFDAWRFAYWIFRSEGF